MNDGGRPVARPVTPIGDNLSGLFQPPFTIICHAENGDRFPNRVPRRHLPEPCTACRSELIDRPAAAVGARPPFHASTLPRFNFANQQPEQGGRAPCSYCRRLPRLLHQHHADRLRWRIAFHLCRGSCRDRPALFRHGRQRRPGHQWQTASDRRRERSLFLPTGCARPGRRRARVPGQPQARVGRLQSSDG